MKGARREAVNKRLGVLARSGSLSRRARTRGTKATRARRRLARRVEEGIRKKGGRKGGRSEDVRGMGDNALENETERPVTPVGHGKPINEGRTQAPNSKKREENNDQKEAITLGQKDERGPVVISDRG